jgi:hypothetical protein
MPSGPSPGTTSSREPAAIDLQFALLTEGPPDSTLYLTNSFLTWKDGLLSLPAATGHLVVPMLPGQQAKRIAFVVLNNFTNATADAVTVRMFIANNLRVSPDPLGDAPDIWRQGAPAVSNFETILFNEQYPIKRKSGKVLPSLLFTPKLI